MPGCVAVAKGRYGRGPTTPSSAATSTPGSRTTRSATRKALPCAFEGEEQSTSAEVLAGSSRSSPRSSVALSDGSACVGLRPYRAVPGSAEIPDSGKRSNGSGGASAHVDGGDAGSEAESRPRVHGILSVAEALERTQQEMAFVSPQMALDTLAAKLPHDLVGVVPENPGDLARVERVDMADVDMIHIGVSGDSGAWSVVADALLGEPTLSSAKCSQASLAWFRGKFAVPSTIEQAAACKPTSGQGQGETSARSRCRCLLLLSIMLCSSGRACSLAFLSALFCVGSEGGMPKQTSFSTTCLLSLARPCPCFHFVRLLNFIRFDPSGD